MKILMAHNFYRSSAPSGEDGVYRNEKALLESRVGEVIEYERFNDDIDISSVTKKIGVALDAAWSRQTYDELSKQIRTSKPAIAHFHSIFPQISPSAYAACQDNGVPVVHTLHNYRFICPGALLMRDGRPCEDCVGAGKTLIPALRHRCYRGSLLATGAQVWTISRNRMYGTYHKLVNRYIALTQFAARTLINGGLPADRFEIKPNFLPMVPKVGAGDGNYAIYVGRLTPEKGVATMLRAWTELPHVPLKIVGDGELRDTLERQSRELGLAVEFTGFLQQREILELIRRASFQVVPSEWYEGFPMVVLEAYACGTPVIASRIGSLDEIVIDDVTGVKFTPGNAQDLADKVTRLLTDRDALHDMRIRVRKEFDDNFTADRTFNQLMAIYERASADFATRRNFG